jgi:hypothetical protein
MRSCRNPLGIEGERRVQQVSFTFWYPDICKPMTELLMQFMKNASVLIGCTKTRVGLPVCMEKTCLNLYYSNCFENKSNFDWRALTILRDLCTPIRCLCPERLHSDYVNISRYQTEVPYQSSSFCLSHKKILGLRIKF